MFALAKLLQAVSLPPDVKLYQYIDDILIGGDSPEKVGKAATAVQQALQEIGVELPLRNIKGQVK